MIAATAIVYVGLRKGATRQTNPERDETSPFRELWTLLHDDRAVLRFVIGNALLTLGLGGLKSFVVLWLTEGLDKSMTFTAGRDDRGGRRHRHRRAHLRQAGRSLRTGARARHLAVRLRRRSVGRHLLDVGAGARRRLSLHRAGRRRGGRVSPTRCSWSSRRRRSTGSSPVCSTPAAGSAPCSARRSPAGAIDLLRPFFPASHGYSAMWPVLSISVMGSTAILWGAGKAKHVA